jgi:uncharacterized protein (TIGR02646 family)
MRPVDKGINETTFTKPQDSKHDLLERLGEYCSYCERSTDLAVEHKKAKSKYPELEKEWENFLLGCLNCNSSKGTKNTDGILFPDAYNTAYAFVYGTGARIQVNPALSDEEKQSAQRTLAFFGLDKVPPPDLSPQDPQRRDDRWLKRLSAWNKAQKTLTTLKKRVNEDTYQEKLDDMLDYVKRDGFFSVWMAVFADEPKICQMLIEAFPGTRRSCFDDTGKAHRTLSV